LSNHRQAGSGQKARITRGLWLRPLSLNYPGKMLYGFGKVGYGLVGIAMFDAFPDAVVQVPLQNDLPRLVQGFFYGIYLNKNILAGDVLINHFVDCPYLPADSVQPFMQIIRIHTLAHYTILSSGLITIYFRCR
jgi:hypothetical protein